MSDSYKPPSGPKATRTMDDGRQADQSRDQSSRGGHRGGRGGGPGHAGHNGRPSGPGRYPTGPVGKRFPDRDNYRPSDRYSTPRDDDRFSGNKRPFPGDNDHVNKRGRGSMRGRGGGLSGRQPPQKGRRDYDSSAKDTSAEPGAKSFNYSNDAYYDERYDNSYDGSQKYSKPSGPRAFDRGNRGRGRGGLARGGRDNNTRGGRFDASSGSRIQQSGAGSSLPATPKAQRAPVPKLALSQMYSVKTPTAEVYKRVQQVGEGTYGKVYKAQNVLTGQFVALKKLRLEAEREGFPITAMREIKLLQSFDHPNVLGLLEMMVEHNQIFMVSDYMDHDLTGLLTHPDLQLSESHRKFIFKQLMEGINYLHCRRIIHRDIKGSNILLDSIGRLKIADFGLARTMKTVKDTESPDYTNRVITIWYRPPELLLGSTDYGREVDIWGVGCLLIELYIKRAAFQGFDEIGQLNKIYNIMGTPTVEDWPTIENLPWFEMLRPRINRSSSFKELFGSAMSEQSFDLAQDLLKYNPAKRWTALEALEHPYFTTEPLPEPLHMLKDIKGEWHEFETKKRRRQERKRVQEEAKAAAQKDQLSKSIAEDSGAEQTGEAKEPTETAEPETGKSVEDAVSVTVLMDQPASPDEGNLKHEEDDKAATTAEPTGSVAASTGDTPNA